MGFCASGSSPWWNTWLCLWFKPRLRRTLALNLSKVLESTLTIGGRLFCCLLDTHSVYLNVDRFCTSFATSTLFLPLTQARADSGLRLSLKAKLESNRNPRLRLRPRPRLKTKLSGVALGLGLGLGSPLRVGLRGFRLRPTPRVELGSRGWIESRLQDLAFEQHQKREFKPYF